MEHIQFYFKDEECRYSRTHSPQNEPLCVLNSKEDILKSVSTAFVKAMGFKTTLDPIDFHCMDKKNDFSKCLLYSTKETYL